MAASKKRPNPTIGRKVAFTRRNGVREHGRIAGTDDKANGRWISVNTAAKGKNAALTNVRESQLTYL